MSTFERYVKQGSGGNTAKLWTIGIIVALVLIIVWNGFVTVPAGHKGVVLRFGKVQNKIDPGLHLLIPFIDDAVKIDTRAIKAEFPKVDTFSKQQQDVTMNLNVIYQVNGNYVEHMYQNYGNDTQIYKKIIEPSTPQAVKSIASQFDTTTIHVKRDEISKDCKDKLNNVTMKTVAWETRNGGVTWQFKEFIGDPSKMPTDSSSFKDITLLPGEEKRTVSVVESDGKYELIYFLDPLVRINSVDIINISYSDAYTQAIEDKQIAQQRVEKAERELEEAKTRKEIAKTQAEAKKIEQELINVSLTPAILQSRWIEKWNGILPTVMGGDNGLILDIGSLGGN